MDAENAKTFEFFSPSSTTAALMLSLIKDGHIVSSDVGDQGLPERDLSSGFSLSGSDADISKSLTLNQRNGFLDDSDMASGVAYKKSIQQGFIREYFPDLALNSFIFHDILSLEKHIGTSDKKLVVRPDLSSTSGSAVFFEPEEKLDRVNFSNDYFVSDKYCVHEYEKGDSYFLNTIVSNGELIITDCWRCINLRVKHRNILTSVINVPLDSSLCDMFYEKLKDIAKVGMFKKGPLHFELVYREDTVKIIKFLPRLAREPLPTLCKMLGIDGQAVACEKSIVHDFNQTGAINFSNKYQGYVADYSFVAKGTGVLSKINHVHDFKSLESYVGDLDVPSVGELIHETVCGSTYGLTILLKNKSKEKLLEDIEFCQKLNATHIFDILN